MNTEMTDPMPAQLLEADLPASWYVHKHRREHEASYWDEARVCITESNSAPLIAPGLLIKFVALAITLAATLGAIVTLIR